jgi:hypothetical protein
MVFIINFKYTFESFFDQLLEFVQLVRLAVHGLSVGLYMCNDNDALIWFSSISIAISIIDRLTRLL